MSGLIGIVARIVKTIAKHITAEDTLAGGGVGVCVDESTDGRIVISGLEIIEPGLYFLAGAKKPFLPTFQRVQITRTLYLIIRKIMQNRNTI